MSVSDRNLEPSPPPSAPFANIRAPKGKACLSCRRRKMKCDCVRPICGQCIRFSRERDCEYTDGDQRSRTEILEENIAQLQERLREFEEAGGPSSSHRPPVPGSSRYPSSGYMMSSEMTIDPSVPSAKGFIEVFLPYASDLGFFLYPQRFLDYVSRQLSSGTHQPTPDALLSVVYLWGCHLSSRDPQYSSEDEYLNRSIQLIASTLTSQSYNPIYLLQAEVLLANYLFYSGRSLEGRAHLGSAAAMVLSYKLNKIRGSVPPNQTRRLHFSTVNRPLRPPRDSIEEGERLQAFWTVYVMDKTWAMALQSEPLLVEDGSPASRIEAPWPPVMDGHINPFPEEYRGSRTIQRFLNEPLSHNPNVPRSLLTLRAQATALLDRAIWLSSTCSADPAYAVVHQQSFNSHDVLIEKFIVSLPAVDTLPSYDPPNLRSLVITHMIARVAILHLHISFADDNMTSGVKCISASKAVLAIFKYLFPAGSDPSSGPLLTADPILPILWSASADVMIMELSRAQANRAVWQASPLCLNIGYLRQVLSDFIMLMQCANRGSTLSDIQVSKAQRQLAQTSLGL